MAYQQCMANLKGPNHLALILIINIDITLLKASMYINLSFFIYYSKFIPNFLQEF